MNLTTIAREHYLPAMEKRNCPDTADGYRSSIELHVLPRFGEKVQKRVARSVLGKTCDDMYKGIIVVPNFAAAA